MKCATILLLGPLTLFGCGTTPPDYARTPVMLVHGLGEDSTVWGVLRRALVRTGYPPEYIGTVNLIPNHRRNVAAAELQLAPAVDSLLLRARTAAAAAQAPVPASRIDLISHSMGALSSRYYVAVLRPDRVRRWISLAGANHGSDRFCPAGPSPASHDLCPAFASAGIQRLLNGAPDFARDETPYGPGADRRSTVRVPPDSIRHIVYFTISADEEVWIVPERSTELDGTGGLAVFTDDLKGVVRRSDGDYVVAGTDHDAVMRDRTTIRLLTRLLLVPDWSGPTPAE